MRQLKIIKSIELDEGLYLVKSGEVFEIEYEDDDRYEIETEDMPLAFLKDDEGESFIIVEGTDTYN